MMTEATNQQRIWALTHPPVSTNGGGERSNLKRTWRIVRDRRDSTIVCELEGNSKSTSNGNLVPSLRVKMIHTDKYGCIYIGLPINHKMDMTIKARVPLPILWNLYIWIPCGYFVALLFSFTVIWGVGMFKSSTPSRCCCNKYLFFFFSWCVLT